MKKLIYCVATFVATLFAASCAQENLQPVGGNIVSFKVEIPEVATKAVAVGNDATMIDDLVYAVYRTTAGSVAEAVENWNEKTTFLYAINSPAGLKRFEDGTDIISIELLNDQNHIVLLWAQHNDTWVDEQGENIKLTEITYPSPLEVSAHVADKYAAFSAVKFIAANDKSNKEPIKLTRPFAQINLATVDPREYDVVINKTTLTVKAAGDKFNVAAQLPADSQDVTYSWAGKVYEDKLSVNLQNYDHYLAMGYVFAAGNVSVDYVIETAKHGIIDYTVTNVPVEKNYRTNIIGNLLTSDVDYNVTLDMNWGDEGENMEVLCEGVVKNINGDYEVSTLEGLVYAINNLFVDANGVANAGTFYVKPGIYDMAQHVINDIVVTSGTLKVYGSETVVTRAVGSGNGVIISGLKKAIIKGVAEGTTVFFSGITIKDFEGADDAAALVQTNSGKVVLAGCDIVDENGNPDEDTELVGGNEPIEVEKGEEAATDLIYTAEQLASAFADDTVESIALGADIALENTLVFPAGRIATLDLRGWELTIADPDKVSTTYALNNHGTLTIKDSYATGQVARGIYNGYGNGGENISTATLTIEGGTFNALGTNGGAAVYNYGVVVIEGGNFKSNGGYGLNNQTGAAMTVTSADVCGGIYNCGTVTVNSSKVYQHLSGKHAIYNWSGSVTINGGEFDSVSGNELILADGQGASVTINEGEFHKTGKSWLYGASTGKDITFVVNGGTHYGYVNQPEMTVDTFRPYGDPIIVTGGAYNFDANAWCDEDYKAVKNEETGMWEVKEKDYTVKIGDKKYETLQEAFNAVEDEQTIKLIEDVVLAETADLPEDKVATLDLNGKNISVVESTANHIYALRNNGKLTITDSKGNGSISARGIYNGSSENTTAVMIIEGGSFNGIDSNGGAAVFNFAELTVNGGQYYGELAAINMNSGNVTINDGIFNGTASGSYVIQNNGGLLTINKAVVESGFGAVGNYKGTTVIEDGSFLPTGRKAATCHVVYVASAADVTVKGGTFKMNYPEDSVPDSGSAVASYYNANVSISGGTFYTHFDNVSPVELSTGSVITGGTYYTHSGNASSHTYITKYVAEGYELVNGVVQREPQPVAKVGTTEYKNIDEAIAAWTNGSTLTLLDNVTLSDVISLKSTEYHVLDLGTFTMTAASKKDAITITAEGRSSASYALDIKADATNPGGIIATSKAVVKTTGKSGVKDRPIIRFYNGVYNASNVISHIGSNGTNCPQFQFHGGEYNCNLSTNRALIQIYGGTFNGKFYISVDSSAYCLISGGKFKYLDNNYGSELNSDKFTIGSSKGSFDRGVYVDDEGYIVVGGAVITEFGDMFAAKATNASKAGSYLPYSSAANHGLYYTNAAAAIAKHGEANVILK